MSDENAYDVIIIGAGPAGSTLAYELASRSLSVCLIEKEKLPRYKPCGGGLTPKTIQLLPFDISELIEDEVHSVTISYNFQKEFTKSSVKPLTFMVMRDRFDYFLVQKAVEKGAELREEAKVEKISQTNGGVDVVLSDKRTLKCAILVGADGALGLTARTAGLEKNFYYGVALEAEIPIDNEQAKKYKGDMSFILGSLDEGYGWIFPKKNHLSVGFGGTTKNGNRLHGLYKKLLSWKNLSESGKLSGHPLKFRLNNEDEIVKDRIILIGEAAGLVDYLGGEGIYYAIWSAQLAAPVIEKAIKKGIELLTEYQEEINREIMPDLLMSKRIADIFYAHPWLVFQIFKRSKKTSDFLFGILTGEKKYRDLKKYADRVQLLTSWLGKKI